MARANFENLRIYQLAESLADDVWTMVKTWPNLARDTVGKQLVRAADSIGANIAEGTGRHTYADNRRFAFMARGSLNESIHWLRRAFRRELLTKQQVDRVTAILDQLPPMLNAYVKSIGRGKSSSGRLTIN